MQKVFADTKDHNSLPGDLISSVNDFNSFVTHASEYLDEVREESGSPSKQFRVDNALRLVAGYAASVVHSIR